MNFHTIFFTLAIHDLLCVDLLQSAIYDLRRSSSFHVQFNFEIFTFNSRCSWCFILFGLIRICWRCRRGSAIGGGGLLDELGDVEPEFTSSASISQYSTSTRAFCYANSDSRACFRGVQPLIRHKLVSDSNQIFGMFLQAAAADL